MTVKLDLNCSAARTHTRRTTQTVWPLQQIVVWQRFKNAARSERACVCLCVYTCPCEGDLRQCSSTHTHHYRHESPTGNYNCYFSVSFLDSSSSFCLFVIVSERKEKIRSGDVKLENTVLLCERQCVNLIRPELCAVKYRVSVRLIQTLSSVAAFYCCACVCAGPQCGLYLLQGLFTWLAAGSLSYFSFSVSLAGPVYLGYVDQTMQFSTYTMKHTHTETHTREQVEPAAQKQTNANLIQTCFMEKYNTMLTWNHCVTVTLNMWNKAALLQDSSTQTVESGRTRCAWCL